MINSLSRQQKEAFGLLQIGTFLEYFDLMLYVHMAVVLNDLFFPPADPHTKTLIAAFAFCSTYLLRPFGAIFFGYIGDTIGRKSTVIITTGMMSIACIFMANLPTYAEIGITAAYILTACRIIQGLSSIGEIIGAQIYITEITKPPIQYPMVSFISVTSALGAAAAVGVASLVTHCGLGWRLAFWLGAGIAAIGSVARTHLRETPEFLAAKQKKQIERYKGRIDYYTLLAFFFICSGWPVTFYLVFIYFNATLSEVYGYSGADIIWHNFLLSLINLCLAAVWATCSYWIYPLTIIKRRALCSVCFIILLPWALSRCASPTHLFLVQSILLLFTIGSIPSEAIILKYIPVFHRFKAASLTFAVSRMIIYVITSFGLVYLTMQLGYFAIWVIALPTITGFIWSVRHFEKLEKQSSTTNSQKSESSVVMQPKVKLPKLRKHRLIKNY